MISIICCPGVLLLAPFVPAPTNRRSASSLEPNSPTAVRRFAPGSDSPRALSGDMDCRPTPHPVHIVGRTQPTRHPRIPSAIVPNGKRAAFASGNSTSAWTWNKYKWGRQTARKGFGVEKGGKISKGTSKSPSLELTDHHIRGGNLIEGIDGAISKRITTTNSCSAVAAAADVIAAVAIADCKIGNFQLINEQHTHLSILLLLLLLIACSVFIPARRQRFRRQ